MSVIKKKPFIEKVYESLTDAQKSTLQTQINASGNAVVNKTISQVESGIHTYLLKLNEFLIIPAICIKTDNYEVALGYGNKQVINIYNLDTETGTYVEIKEHCSIEELRRIAFGGSGGGGGEPLAYLKTIEKDTTNQKIIITDKEDNETEFPYGGGAGASESADVELTTPGDESISGTADNQAEANEEFVEKLDEHEGKIAALSSRGRFLSLWNATTGKPVTDPTDLPYTYKAGDYYVVSAVGATNYRPTGSSYDGTASTTQETSELAVNDTYMYDGTNWLLQKEVAGGSLTPAQLANMMEGSTEVSVDLNASNTKVKVDLHQKVVTISSPSTATSGTLTDEDLAALHESKNSYIVFNNEKYYLNDNGHVSGYLGYSHIGYENSKFILKNITITESTLGWVLSTEEVGGGGVEGADFALTLIPLNPQLTEFQITSNNLAEEIAEYVETHNKMPKVAGIVVAGDDKYLCLGTQIDVEDDGVVVIGVTRSEYYANVREDLHFKIEMEPGHSGTTDGQSVNSDSVEIAFAYHETYNSTTTVGGINVPEITIQKFKALYGKATLGIHTTIDNGEGSEEFVIIAAKLYKNKASIQIKFEDKDVIYYLNNDENAVLIDVLTGSELIQVHSASDLPTAAISDGKVHIVLCDNGLLPAPADQKSGYVYLEKEA